MLRFVILALVAVELVLLTAFALPPANATSSDVQSYFWGFADVGSTQVVCKQLVMHPEKQVQSSSSDRKVMQVYSASKVVNDSYCAKLAKPVVGDS